jgi:hypothetical protein
MAVKRAGIGGRAVIGIGERAGHVGGDPAGIHGARRYEGGVGKAGGHHLLEANGGIRGQIVTEAVEDLAGKRCDLVGEVGETGGRFAEQPPGGVIK